MFCVVVGQVLELGATFSDGLPHEKRRAAAATSQVSGYRRVARNGAAVTTHRAARKPVLGAVQSGASRLRFWEGRPRRLQVARGSADNLPGLAIGRRRYREARAVLAHAASTSNSAVLLTGRLKRDCAHAKESPHLYSGRRPNRSNFGPPPFGGRLAHVASVSGLIGKPHALSFSASCRRVNLVSGVMLSGVMFHRSIARNHARRCKQGHKRSRDMRGVYSETGDPKPLDEHRRDRFCFPRRGVRILRADTLLGVGALSGEHTPRTSRSDPFNDLPPRSARHRSIVRASMTFPFGCLMPARLSCAASHLLAAC